LAVIDPERNSLDNELDVDDLDLVDPQAVFEDLDEAQLAELEKSIDTYLTLETSKSNHEYWNVCLQPIPPLRLLILTDRQTMKTICKDRRQIKSGVQPAARGVGSVAADLDKLLGPKTLAELEKLEKQIRTKLSSNEPIDTDYWEHLLQSLLSYKARAKLRQVSQSIRDARVGGLRKQQAAEAAAFRSRLEARFQHQDSADGAGNSVPPQQGQDDRNALDPDPLLRLRQEDKNLPSVSAAEFMQKVNDERQKVLKIGYVPDRKRGPDALALDGSEPGAKRARTGGADGPQSAFDREVARGLGENEEMFLQEEEVETKNRDQWASQYRPRKPRYFNRVLLGYEWNKYNQTHYDHGNPPPKVVQGYRFNIFYPDLVDLTKAPTYRIERENGRRRGETFAPAGQDDTCLIRFTAGPPYEDVAFRIIDKEWDYSAKRERGFRSSFDKVRSFSMINLALALYANTQPRVLLLPDWD
jgi:hypothetical protein